ncbi:MAG TPA: fibronectin type III domain-containing protein [Tepidisphaeraceae bacterium]|nr:fibronectin type III domain-containing protein [Tepidisphaeraceae bacterium]
MFRRIFRTQSCTGNISKRSAAVNPIVEPLEDRRLLSVSIIDGREMETLNRGVIAMNKGSGQVYVGWRQLATDPDDVTFNLYRSTGGAAAVKVNSSPLGTTTDFLNTSVDTAQNNAYFVRPVVDGVEQAASETFTLPANAPAQQFLRVPLQIPPGGTTSDGVAYTYSANDTSIGDLDGNGDYEFIVKWDPSNSKDNANDGYTGNQIIDAYKLDGTRMWRIDLGINIRSGAHYTQFIVYDLDGDGKSEIAMKTADGTRDGLGTVIGSATADWRNSAGRILSGPEYLTIFNGQTGAAMATTNYLPARGNVADWGDTYGNRVDRFLATVAYLDGVHPSLVMTRGYYDKSVLVAWDYRNTQLTHRWTFDSKATGNNAYSGQGNHNLTAADVDGDGKDEIVFGAMTIDDNGAGRYSTGLGHGDAMHVSDMDPGRAGLEVFSVHESPSAYGAYGGSYYDASTGTMLQGISGNNSDVGRGNAFDIDPRYAGSEMWTSADLGIYNVSGTRIQDKPSNMFINSGVWWDADPLRELLDGTTISDWRITNGIGGRFNFDLDPASSNTWPPGVSSNNSTKSNACLSGDIFGDWREEVIWRRSDNTALDIYSTTIASTRRLDTLVHDSQYRMSLAWQNVGYNQPPHTSFFLGEGMVMPAPAPTNLAATAASSTRIDLTWTASAGATGYNVKRSTSASGPFTTIATDVTTTSYADTGVTGGATYYYFVTAVNAAGGSLNSNQASATTPGGTNAAPTVATPASASANPATGTATNLSVLGADDAGEASLTYTWSATGPAAVTYSINGTNAAKNSTATFSRAGSYIFTATITDSGGLTTASSVNVTVNQTLTSVDVTPGTASVATNGSQQFTATGYDQFGVSMSTQPTFTWSVTSGGGTVSTSGLYTAPSTTGSATVQAAMGSISDMASVTIVSAPVAPSSLTATAASSSQINLAWTDNSSNEDGFKIERSTDGINFTQIATVEVGVTGYASSGLSASTTYQYRVRAYNAVGDSAYSNTASATTQAASNVPAAPSSLTASVTQKNKAKLSWLDNASNEHGFHIWSSRDGVTWTLMATLGASAGTGKTMQYTSGSLATGTWYFKLTAYNAAGDSTDSNLATLTI